MLYLSVLVFTDPRSAFSSCQLLPHALCWMEAGDNIIRELGLSEYAHEHIDSVHMCWMLHIGLQQMPLENRAYIQDYIRSEGTLNLKACILRGVFFLFFCMWIFCPTHIWSMNKQNLIHWSISTIQNKSVDFFFFFKIRAAYAYTEDGFFSRGLRKWLWNVLRFDLI